MISKANALPAVCYGYGRVSTERQHKDGLSLEDQSIRIEQFYKSNLEHTGCRWGGFFQDGGVSGSTCFMDRPGGKVLYDRLRPGDHVVMTKLDRGFRNLRDFLEVTEKWLGRGIYIHMMDMGGGLAMDTSTPQGEMYFHVFAAMAQMMRRIIREACMAGMARRKDKYGSSNAEFGIGFRNVGTSKHPRVVPFVEERRQMALICHLVEDLRVPVIEVERLFSYYNFETTPGGATWTGSRIRKALKAYIEQGLTESCCEFPPPPNWSPYKRKAKAPLRTKAPAGEETKGKLLGRPKRWVPAPASWCLQVRVTDSTLPLRAMRLLSPTTAVSLPPLLPGQVLPSRRCALVSQSGTSSQPSSTSQPKKTRTPLYVVLSPPSECDVHGPLNSITECSMSSRPPDSQTSS